MPRHHPRHETHIVIDPRRRAIAVALGADTLDDELPRRLGSFAVTVDACADPEGLSLALRSTAPDGVCTSCAIGPCARATCESWPRAGLGLQALAVAR